MPKVLVLAEMCNITDARAYRDWWSWYGPVKFESTIRKGMFRVTVSKKDG